MNFLAVAFGGAIGAAGRYAISLMPVKAEFPVLTLLTNVPGRDPDRFYRRCCRRKCGYIGECGIVLEDRRVRRVYDIFHIFT